MTNKKIVTKRAKALRKQIKGMNLPLSVKLVKLANNQSDFLDALRNAGYHLVDQIDGYCPTDGCPSGFVKMYKNGNYKGKIAFDCCGFLLPH